MVEYTRTRSMLNEAPVRLVRTLLLAALITTTSSTTAQATRWVTYTEADGLPSHVVVDLVQVPDGSVWAATWNGIARLDRRQPAGHWEVVTDEVFDALAVDSNGIIWAGGKNGRLQWFDVHGDSLPTPVQLPQDASGDVTALEPGPGGEMWIGQGSRAYGSRLRRWRPNPPGLDGWGVTGTIRHLDSTVLGHVWIGMDAGLGFSDGATLQLYPIGDKPADKDIHAVLVLCDDLFEDFLEHVQHVVC